MAQADGMVAVLETKTLLFTKLQALEKLISCLENGHIGDEGSKILQDVEDAIVKGELVLQKREKDLNYVDSLENDQDFVFKQLKRLLNILEKRRRRATTLFCSENNRKHFLLFVNPKKVQHSLHPRIQVTSERKIPVYLHPGQSPLADKGRRRVPHLSIPYRAVIKGKYSHLPQRLGKQIQPHSGTVTTYGSCAYRSSSCDFDNDSHKFYSFQQMIAADVTGMRYAERCDSANNQVSFNMVDHDACRTSHCFDEKQGKINSIESMPAWSCRELEKTKPIFASDDEFWEALQSDYDYLMDEELMKTCKETSDELSLSSPNDETPFTTSTWSFTELINNFNVLQNSLSHLISVIMKINKMGEQDVQKELQMGKIEIKDELLKKKLQVQKFQEQGDHLQRRYPDMKDEISRLVHFLNNKLNVLEDSVVPHKSLLSEDELFNEIARQTRRLHRWLRDLERENQRPVLDRNWTQEQICSNFKEQQSVQKELESRGKCLSSLFKLCDKVEAECNSGNFTVSSRDGRHVRRIAHSLERRWHALLLQTLEWRYILEEFVHRSETGVLSKAHNPNLLLCEPGKKYSQDKRTWYIFCNSENVMDSSSLSQQHTKEPYAEVPTRQTCNIQTYSVTTNDKSVMVGETGIAELKAECGSNVGPYEIVQDVGYSSESSVHFSYDENMKTFTPVSRFSTELPELNAVASESLLVYDSNNGLSVLSGDPQEQVYNPSSSQGKGMNESIIKYTTKGTQMELCSNVNCTSNNLLIQVKEDRRADAVLQTNNEVDIYRKNKSIQGLDINRYSAVLAGNSLDALDFSHLTNSNDEVKDVSVISEGIQEEVSIKDQNAEVANKLSSTSVIGGCKTSRIQQWLEDCDPEENGSSASDTPSIRLTEDDAGFGVDSSCDASGENTSNDTESEISADERNASSVLNKSIAGSVETVVPFSVVDEPLNHKKRTSSMELFPRAMRRRKRTSRDRPWSVTELNQLPGQWGFSPYTAKTISEGALDTLSLSPFVHHKLKFTRGSHSLKNSPIQESKSFLPQTGRCRYRSQSSVCCSVNQSDSSSEGFSLCSQHSTRLNQSFGGATNATRRKRSLVFSDKSRSRRGSLVNFHTNQQATQVFIPTSDKGGSDGDSLHRKHVSSIENEKFDVYPNQSDCETEASLPGTQHLESVLDNEHTQAHTDQGSQSDQVWDHYQDLPYLSEPVSEFTADEDEVKKLLEFGDDYRAFFGSQSDASSISSCVQSFSQKFSSEPSSIWSQDKPVEFESDSDIEDFRHVLEESQKALQFSVKQFHSFKSRDCGSISHSEYAELIVTCRTYLISLHEIRAHVDTGHLRTLLSKEDFIFLQDSIVKWESFQAEVVDHQKQGTMSEQEKEVCKDIHNLWMKMTDQKLMFSKKIGPFCSLEELDNQIEINEMAQVALQETRTSLVELNVTAHRIMTISGSSSSLSKDKITELYQLWDELYDHYEKTLSQLNTVRIQWQTYNEKFKNIQENVESVEMSSSSPEATTIEQNPEEDLAELYRLSADLEPKLDGGQAWSVLSDQLSSLNERVCQLRRRGQSSDTKQMKAHEEENSCENAWKEVKSETFSTTRETTADVVSTSGAEEVPLVEEKVSEEKTNQGCFWRRVIRFAIPFQLAVVALCCVACLMEPHCCDYVNNLNFSFAPQLRYIGGRPPV